MPIRSPLGAIGVILVALEAVFSGALFALDDMHELRTAMVATMIAVFAAVTLVVLWMVVYLTLKNPGFLFNPAEVAKLSESVQRGIYAIPVENVAVAREPVSLMETSDDLQLYLQLHEDTDAGTDLVDDETCP